MLSIFIFKLKRSFFKNDTSVVIGSLLFFLAGILIYIIINIVSAYWQLIDEPLWPFSIFLPLWVSVVALVVAIMVSLKINMSETQSGEDFLINLISEIGYLNDGDQLKIITPNLNIGQYKYPDLFKQLSKALNAAKNRNVTIEFYCLSICSIYLKSFKSVTEPGDRLNHLRNGKSNNSSMLQYIYEKNKKELADSAELVIDTISELNAIIASGKIFSLNDNFEKSKMVGFLSNKRCYIGKYSEIRPIDGKVNVSGKIIELEETVECLLEYYLYGVKEIYK